MDIDGDFLLTELAPSDMLLQRIGRLWRHQKLPEVAARRPICARREVWIKHPYLSDDADATQLEAALGKSARVYAPYVLLRSLAEWRQIAQRGSLALPQHIRPLLEATYDPGKERSDTPAWVALRRQLETQAEEMGRQALSATHVWTLPDLEDEEGIQTRWSKQKTASLILIRRCRLVGSDGLQLEPLYGPSCQMQPHDWSFAAARTIHRNLVRVDRWLVRDGISATEAALGPAAKALAYHVPGEVALGIVGGSPNGTIRWPGSKAHASDLLYDEDLGVERLPRETRVFSTATYLQDDESYD